MTDGLRPKLFTDVAPPDYMTADDSDSDWGWYVAGHDPDELWVFDDPAVLDHECLWMRPERISSLDEDDRGDGWDSVTRDARGRFQPAYCWSECSKTHPAARPFMGARYKP